MAIDILSLALLNLASTGCAHRWPISPGLDSNSDAEISDSTRPRDVPVDLTRVSDRERRQALPSLLLARLPSDYYSRVLSNGRNSRQGSMVSTLQSAKLANFVDNSAKDQSLQNPRHGTPHMTLAQSRPNDDAFSLALAAARTFSELQVAKMQLPVMRQLSSIRKSIKERRILEEANRQKASELRREQLAADADSAPVELDGDLVISTARTLAELLFAKIELLIWRRFRWIRNGFSTAADAFKNAPSTAMRALKDTPFYARAVLELAYDRFIEKHAARLQEDLQSKLEQLAAVPKQMATLPDVVQADAKIKMKDMEVEAQERFDNFMSQLSSFPDKIRAETQAKLDESIDKWAGKGRAVLSQAKLDESIDKWAEKGRAVLSKSKKSA